MSGHPERFADSEDAHGHDHDVDAVAQLRDAEVSRDWPLTASMPTNPMVRPMNGEMKPRSREAPSTAVTAMKANSMTAKYSGAPSEMAKRVTTGAKRARPRVPMVPATKEPSAAVANAWAARPDLAIRLPSMAVTTDDDSPGVFNRIEVVEPPYMPP